MWQQQKKKKVCIFVDQLRESDRIAEDETNRDSARTRKETQRNPPGQARGSPC